MRIKEFLRKITKYEFKTDAGFANLVGFLGLVIFLSITKVFVSIEQLIWRCFFHIEKESYNPAFYLMVPALVLIASILCVSQGEKDAKKSKEIKR